MALSDCPKCWDTPCSCGYEYRNYSKEYMIEFICNFLSYHSKKDAIDVLKEAEQKIITKKEEKKEEFKGITYAIPNTIFNKNREEDYKKLNEKLLKEGFFILRNAINNEPFIGNWVIIKENGSRIDLVCEPYGIDKFYVRKGVEDLGRLLDLEKAIKIAKEN